MGNFCDTETSLKNSLRFGLKSFLNIIWNVHENDRTNKLPEQIIHYVLFGTNKCQIEIGNKLVTTDVSSAIDTNKGARRLLHRNTIFLGASEAYNTGEKFQTRENAHIITLKHRRLKLWNMRLQLATRNDDLLAKTSLGVNKVGQ